MNRIECIRSTGALSNILKDNPPNENYGISLLDENSEESTFSTPLTEYDYLVGAVESAGLDHVNLESLTDSLTTNPKQDVTQQYTFYIDDNYEETEEDIQNRKKFIDFDDTAPARTELMDIDRFANSIANQVMSNNFVDEIRGNVFKTERMSNVRVGTFDEEDAQKMFNKTYLPVSVHRLVFQATDAMLNNRINNPFAGMELAEGCSISFWMRHTTVSQKQQALGLMFFMDGYKEHINPDPHHDHEQVIKSNRMLYLTTNMSCYFNAIFGNVCNVNHNQTAKLPNNMKDKWHHVIMSLTEEKIVLYLDGKRLEVDEWYGKRFQGHTNGNPKNDMNFNILDFITQEDTKLYLGTTIDHPVLNNTSRISEPVLFDDIIFYDSSVPDDDTAAVLYQEALTINLP